MIASIEDPQIRDMLHVDFSAISDLHYYNGIVFKCFVEGVPSAVLSGGQYDRLMEKMGHKSRAIGFAVYLDTLKGQNTKNYDADVALLYTADTDMDTLHRAAESLRAQGLTVQAQRNLPEKAKYRQIMRICGGEVTAVENHA